MTPSSVSSDGQLVFIGVVTLVNLKILLSTSNYTFFTFFLTIGSVLTFILAFYIVNLLTFYSAQDIYMEFHFVFESPMTYFSLFLVTVGIAVMDSGFQTVDKEIREFLHGKEEQTIKKEKEKLTKNRANIQTRRVTNVACKIFPICLI